MGLLKHDPHIEEDRTPWLLPGQEECASCGRIGSEQNMHQVNDQFFCKNCFLDIEEEICK